MGYKQPSSGLPFKQMGSSPAKQSDLTNEVNNTRSNSEENSKKRSNTSFEGDIMTNTETGDTYNLKTGETTKNKKPKAEPRSKKSATPFKESPAKTNVPTEEESKKGVTAGSIKKKSYESTANPDGSKETTSMRTAEGRKNFVETNPSYKKTEITSKGHHSLPDEKSTTVEEEGKKETSKTEKV